MYRQSSYYGYNKPQVVNVQSNSYIIQYGMYLIFGFLFYLVFNIIFDTLYNKYFIVSPFISWWKNGIKNIKNIDTLFNIDHVLDFENDNKIVYYIKSMFWSMKGSSGLNMPANSNFLNNYVKYNIYNPKDKSFKENSFITPRHLVRSIQFNTDDGQLGINQWYNSFTADGLGGDSELNPIKWGSDNVEWMNRIAWWCGCTNKAQVFNPYVAGGKKINSFWIQDASNYFVVNQEKNPNILLPDNLNLTSISKTWEEAITKPNIYADRMDNVFARFGISYKSPIISWLVNKVDEHDSELNRRGAALKLIGLSENGLPLSEGTLGGWLGFINDQSMTTGVSSIDALFESEHVDPANIAKTPSGSKCNNKTGKPQQNKPSRGDWIKDGASVGLGVLMILFGGPEGMMMGTPQLLAGADLYYKSTGTSKCGYVGDS